LNDIVSKPDALTIDKAIDLSSNGIILAQATEEGTQKTGLLLPVDLDIVHPATGEVNEQREDSTLNPGIVAVKRDNKSPVTKLVIKPIAFSGDLKFKLRFNQGDRYRLWKNVAMTEAVTSEQTEFDGSQETTLYFEGLKKSQQRAAELITQIITLGNSGASYDGDSVRVTVVEAEFDVWLNLFIPVQWGDLPFPFSNPITGDKIFGGDDRGFYELPFNDPALDVNGEGTAGQDSSSRTHQQITVIPYVDLDADGVKENTKIQVVGESHNYKKDGSVPKPDEGYSPTNRLFQNPVVSNSGDGNTDDMDIQVAPALPGQIMNAVNITFGSSADNPIVNPSLAIDWSLNLFVSCDVPLNPIFVLTGKQDGFPAYEMYVRDSDGKGGAPEGTKVYQYDPIPLGLTPTSLEPGKDDVTIQNVNGDIE